MNVSPRKLLGYSWAALGCGLLPVFLLALQEPPAPKHRLPNGGYVELRGVTYEKRPSFQDGPAWRLLLNRVLGPDRVWALFHPGQTLGFGMLISGSHYPIGYGSQDFLWMWLSGRGAANLWSGYWHSQVRDSDGCILDPAACVAAGNSPYAESCESILLQRFPRRGPSFEFIAHYPDDPPVTLCVPNPVPGAYPHWISKAYPIHVRKGGHVFTLLALAYDGRDPATGCDRQRAEFTVDGMADTSRHWALDQLEVGDATGNTVRTYSSAPPTRCTFPSLCRHEGAWRLKARFMYAHPEEEQPLSTWTFADVPAPRRGEVVKLMRSRKVNGMRLRLGWVGGGGVMHDPLAGADYDANSLPQLQAQAWSPHRTVLIALLSVQDQHGRALFRRGTEPRWWDGRPRYSSTFITDQRRGGDDTCDLRYPKGTRRLTFTFGAFPVYTTEYLARPG